MLIQVLKEAKPFIWFIAWYVVNRIPLGLYIFNNEINMHAFETYNREERETFKPIYYLLPPYRFRSKFPQFVTKR